MSKRAFGELEITVLQQLKSGERMTVKQVHQLLGGEDKYTTIMTVMNRLVQKNQLNRERKGMQYEYWMVPSQNKAESFLEQFKKKLFAFKTASVVSYLIESADDISEEDLEEMKKMIEKTKVKRKK